MIDFEAAIREYEGRYDDNDIEYQDASGTWQTDGTPRFTSMSPAIQARDPPSLSHEELLRIGRWKVQSKRLDRWLTDLDEQRVRNRTTAAFQATEEDNDTTAVEELTELDGVGVPVASSVLTMFDPKQYAVIDFRAFRALSAVYPELTDPEQYQTYAEFLDHFRSYNTNPETYAFYVDHVRQLAREHGLSCREVDMALWVFDEMNHNASSLHLTGDL